MNDGFIVLFRKIVSWEWYTDIPAKTLFLHCLFKANWEDKKWHGEVIKRGSFVTSQKNLSKETGLTPMQVRTALNKLKSTNEITCETTNKFSLITVVNYRVYQDYDDASNKQNNMQPNNQITNEQQTNNNQITNEQQTNNNQITTTNNNNHYNNNNNITNNIYSQVVNYLNERVGTKYKSSSQKTHRLIDARLNEKFTLQDFKDVIDKQCVEWMGTPMEKYLRPETLFGPKFEGYLNAKVVAKEKSFTEMLDDVLIGEDITF